MLLLRCMLLYESVPPGETCYLETDLNVLLFLDGSLVILRVTNYVVLCYVYSVYVMSSGRVRQRNAMIVLIALN